MNVTELSAALERLREDHAELLARVMALEAANDYYRRRLGPPLAEPPTERIVKP